MKRVECHKEGLFIQKNGDVFPCCGTWNKPNLKIGNILDDDLLTKIENFSATCSCDSYELVCKQTKITERYNEINIETSYKCQATCAMCCVYAPTDDGYYNQKNYNAILNLLKLTQPKNIMLQGGEVLVQKDTMQWIEVIKETLPSTTLTLITNGNNVNKLEYAKKVFDNISISFVGFQEHTYSTLMGLNLHKTLHFAEEISKVPNTNLYLKYLLSPLNIHELPIFIDWAMKINPKGIIIHDSNSKQYIEFKTWDNYWNKIIQRTKESLVKEITKNLEQKQTYNFRKISLGGYKIANFLQIDADFLINNNIDSILKIDPINYRFIESY